MCVSDRIRVFSGVTLHTGYTHYILRRMIGEESEKEIRGHQRKGELNVGGFEKDGRKTAINIVNKNPLIPGWCISYMYSIYTHF